MWETAPDQVDPAVLEHMHDLFPHAERERGNLVEAAGIEPDAEGPKPPEDKDFDS